MKFAELDALYRLPLFDLISQSRAVHLHYWRGEEVQPCSLLSMLMSMSPFCANSDCQLKE